MPNCAILGGFMLRAVIVLSVGAATLIAPAPGFSAQEEPPEPEVVLVGKGFGHGVGMAQDGAYAMARAGASATDILTTFYPGTSIGQRSGSVRVNVLDAPVSEVVLSFPSGGEVGERGGAGQSPGLPVTIRPGGSLRVSSDGGYRVTPLDRADLRRSTPPETTPAEPVAGSALWAVSRDDASVVLPELGKRYRGTVQVQAAGGGLQLVNHLDVEDYLRGISEVPSSWPAAAQQAQAIAARTYALRFAAAGQPLCSSQQCQVYAGQTAESGAKDIAVAATAGQVVTYEGRLAETVYSASAGGVSATAEEGFGPGSPEFAYLQAVPYPTEDPHPWEERMTLRRLAAVARYPGEVADVTVTRTGPSGRPLEITFTGDADALAVDAHTLADRLDLQSTFFTIRVERPAPAAGDPVAVAAPAPGVAERRHAPVVLQAGAEDGRLGRTPWIAFALVLVVVVALAAKSCVARTP
ncbi:MAG: SpoIID/LytB domain-containing protein [Acidimicrobiales bacterium]